MLSDSGREQGQGKLKEGKSEEEVYGVDLRPVFKTQREVEGCFSGGFWIPNLIYADVVYVLWTCFCAYVQEADIPSTICTMFLQQKEFQVSMAAPQRLPRLKTHSQGNILHPNSHAHTLREASGPPGSAASSVLIQHRPLLPLTRASLHWYHALTFNPVSSTLNSLPRIVILSADFLMLMCFQRCAVLCDTQLEAGKLLDISTCFTVSSPLFLSGSIRSHRQSVCCSPQQVHVPVWRNLWGQSDSFSFQHIFVTFPHFR